MEKQFKRWLFVIMSALIAVLFSACGDKEDELNPESSHGKDYAPESLLPGSILSWQGKIILTLNNGEQRELDFGTSSPFKFQIINSYEGQSNYRYAYSTSYYTYKKLATNKANFKLKVECLLMGSKYVHYDYDMILDFTSPTTMNISGTYEFDFLYTLDCKGTLIIPMY